MNASEPREDAVADALKAARQFIVNGVELGYIRLPEPPDTALQTLPKIEAAIAALAQQGAEPVAWVALVELQSLREAQAAGENFNATVFAKPTGQAGIALVPATGAPR